MKSQPVVSYPANFDRRSDVVLMARQLGGRVDYAFLLWLEWADTGAEWRPLTAAVGHSIDWSQEDVLYLINRFVDWRGTPDTAVIDAALASGMLRLENRGDRQGLVLADFAACNGHLLKDRPSLSQKGGAAKSVKRFRGEAAKAARDHRRLQEMRATGELIYPDGMTAADHEAGVGLIMRLDRACNLPSRSEFPDDLVSAACDAIAVSSEEGIDATLAWLITQRENPETITRTDRVLRDWREYLQRACPPHTQD